MCGRYVLKVDKKKEFLDYFDVEDADFDIQDNYNVSPSQVMPVIERHSPNSIHLRSWGIQPAWSNRSLINATSEKLTTSRVWSKAFREQRCIVPASGFIEWEKIGDYKEPNYIQLKESEYMGLAGLNVNYTSKEGKEESGYVIVTQPANKFMSKIHHREPLILDKDGMDRWLNPDNTPDDLEELLNPFPASWLKAHPVSNLINTPKNNDESLLEEVPSVK